MISVKKIKDKKHMIVYFCIFITMLILLYIVIYKIINNPISLIEERTTLKLSNSISIVHYERNIFDDFHYIDNIKAKLKINEKEKEDIINQLKNNILPKYKNPPLFKNIPDFSIRYHWFAFNEDDVVYLFRAYRTDYKFNDKHMHDIWIIITCENNEYYLYISL